MKRHHKNPIQREYHALSIRTRNDIHLAMYVNAHAAIASQVSSHELEIYKNGIKERQWRNKYSISALKQRQRGANKTFSLGTMSSGGCLDTIAAIREGFRPIWGTEICEKKRALWRNLTNTRDLGDTFAVEWENEETPDLIISGQNCMDYSHSGTQTGEDGKTGWAFVKQTEELNKLQPNAICLEMVDNAINVHNGREVRKVITELEKNYIYNKTQNNTNSRAWRRKQPNTTIHSRHS